MRYQLATVIGPEVLTPEDWNELTLWQRTILSWPRVIYDTDEWNALAMETQTTLIRETGERLDVEDPLPQEPTGKDPQDRSDAYKASRPPVPEAFDAISDVHR